MREQMTMNRVIHAAVRRDLTRLEAALAEPGAADPRHAQQLHEAFTHLCGELVHHHEGEDDLVFPMLAGLGVDVRLLEQMETEHEAMAAALQSAADAMDVYLASASAADAASARAAVAHAREVTEEHLRHEEDELEPIFFPLRESPEFKAIEKRLRPPSLTGTGRFLAWIQDGMDEPARTYLRGTIPPPVLFVFSRVLGRSYHRDVAPAWR